MHQITPLLRRHVVLCWWFIISDSEREREGGRAVLQVAMSHSDVYICVYAVHICIRTQSCTSGKLSCQEPLRHRIDTPQGVLALKAKALRRRPRAHLARGRAVLYNQRVRAIGQHSNPYAIVPPVMHRYMHVYMYMHTHAIVPSEAVRRTRPQRVRPGSSVSSVVRSI